MKLVMRQQTQEDDMTHVQVNKAVMPSKKLELTSRSPVDLLLRRPASTDAHATQ